MIYVDSPVRYPNAPFRYKVFSHMWSDECDQELHEMADKIGLRREWFQCAPQQATDTMKRLYNHYDVTPRLRNLAIQYGAQAVTSYEVMNFIREQLDKKPPFVVRFGSLDAEECDMLGDPAHWANVGPE